VAKEQLKLVGRIAGYVVAGYRYRDQQGYEYDVFTAGDGTRWDAIRIIDGGLCRFVVRDLASRQECLEALRAALEREHS
jgi:hypothetical protein